MEIVRFLLGDDQFPVYRTVSRNESEILRALLGSDFHFELEEGEPMDKLLFDVLSAVSMKAQFYFAPPPEADLLGTFELRDEVVRLPDLETRPRGLPPRVH